MKEKTALKTIYLLSLAGVLFSGFLSYNELVRGVCVFGGGCSIIAGLPSCVYGFVVFLAVFIISILGLYNKGKK